MDKSSREGTKFLYRRESLRQASISNTYLNENPSSALPGFYTQASKIDKIKIRLPRAFTSLHASPTETIETTTIMYNESATVPVATTAAMRSLDIKILFGLLIALIVILAIAYLCCIRALPQDYSEIYKEDLLFSTPRYINAHLKWLTDAVALLPTTMNHEEVHKRYIGVEKRLKRYCKWQVKKKAMKKAMALVWDEAGMVAQRREFLMRLDMVLRMRKEALVVMENGGAAVDLSLERKRVDAAARVFSAERWGAFI
ncbi:uncharacterized protein LY89DRAFT_242156 [Mollisia scopiformis]|uniref:Uncharacterized protein n=1 Tax=Mollisia scopiformis TaxID=149040 RepID=A0A194WTK9_MOLSC|nr:uncharacterized protein LY89DRAFT_242156 [Mollisia scopiformis]KUJ11298.1 hypothetical protein LY89DRAFT_242156 [Mollisia scopiformis]